MCQCKTLLTSKITVQPELISAFLAASTAKADYVMMKPGKTSGDNKATSLINHTHNTNALSKPIQDDFCTASVAQCQGLQTSEAFKTAGYCCISASVGSSSSAARGMASQIANGKHVFLGVSACLVLAAIPFGFKIVRQRESNVVTMRDAAADAKDNARDQRLRTTSR